MSMLPRLSVSVRVAAIGVLRSAAPDMGSRRCRVAGMALSCIFPYIARMSVRFTKMHGCGNDFVVFDERPRQLGITPARARALADRRTGIGCDQLISIEPGFDGAD